MKRTELWRLSLRNVFAAPMRSMLTVLGMSIGIGAILAVLSLGEAGRTQVRSEMGRLGIDKVWVTAAEAEALRHGDAELLSQRLSLDAAGAAYLTAELVCRAEADTGAVIACEESYLRMLGVSLAQGRMLYPLEWEADSRSVLIGAELAKTLGAKVGDVILVESMPFCVRGMLDSSDAFARVDPANALFLPLEAVRTVLGDVVHEIMLDVPANTMPQHIAAMAQDVLLKSRSLSVETLTLQVQMEAASSVITIFVEVLKWVAFICILVGGIGVMNILLVSVRERRREIGVMKSLGTTHGQICTMFLLEALVYAVIGGVLGICVGCALIAVAGRSIGLHASARPGDCVWVLLCALTVGLLSGVAPASRAAKLSCVQALRDE